jgi:hypothetical protein
MVNQLKHGPLLQDGGPQAGLGLRRCPPERIS